MCVRTGRFRTLPKPKKVRQCIRARGRNCLRTRAHGRRQLTTSPWCSGRRRMSPRTSLTLTLSTWRRRTLPSSMSSTLGAGGGASGFQLASSIAGGWPLWMGPRLAILSGGLHGPSAPGHGDDAMVEFLSWCVVRQWIQVPAVAVLWRCLFQFIVRVVDTAVMLQRQVHTVSNCARSSKTLSWRRLHFFCWSRAADHRDFPVAVH